MECNLVEFLASNATRNHCNTKPFSVEIRLYCLAHPQRVISSHEAFDVIFQASGESEATRERERERA